MNHRREWFAQAEYDLATAEAMLKATRYIYTVCMCHQAIEKALKGLSVPTRYPDEIKRLLKEYKFEPTKNVLGRTKELPAVSETEIRRSRLAEILKELLAAKGIRADRIVVFSSFARGLQKKDSDIDIIIVSRDFRKRSVFERAEVTTGIGREMVKKFRKPFDLMYYSDLEWKQGHSLVINAAKESGQVIYG